MGLRALVYAALVMCTGCAGLSRHGHPTYGYRLETVDIHDWNLEKIGRKADEMGAKGWRLVTMMNGEDRVLFLMFERPLSSQE